MSTENDLLTGAGVPAPRTAAEPMQTPWLERFRVATGARFRLPAEDDAPPANSRLLGLAFWAAACVFVGLIPAARLVAAYVLTGGPAWYPPLTLALGLTGLALIAAAFASIHRAFLPWHLLGVATLLLLANLTLVYVAL